MNTTWRKLIDEERKRANDTSDLVHCTLTEEQLNEVFDAGMGDDAPSFTLWTEARVYFLAIYDSSVWAASAPRNPCDEVTRRVGGT